MTRPLVLERGAELDVLKTALRRATGGTGSVVLISGEAGIGKTSLVRAFVLDRPDRARVLLGACDDLVTPRTLGPLRDAVRGAGGPLATALATGDRDAVLSALVTELADGTRPTATRRSDRPCNGCSARWAVPPCTGSPRPGSPARRWPGWSVAPRPRRPRSTG